MRYQAALRPDTLAKPYIHWISVGTSRSHRHFDSGEKAGTCRELPTKAPQPSRSLFRERSHRPHQRTRHGVGFWKFESARPMSSFTSKANVRYWRKSAVTTRPRLASLPHQVHPYRRRTASQAGAPLKQSGPLVCATGSQRKPGGSHGCLRVKSSGSMGDPELDASGGRWISRRRAIGIVTHRAGGNVIPGRA
jgi:hypothetical protein